MPNNILITPGSASIQFSGSVANTIRLQVEPSGSIAFYGNSGSLFGISDSLSGSLMSVNDISGLPILEVFSDDRVVMGTFNRNTLVVTGSRVGIDKAVPTADLDISGSVFVTGSLLVQGIVSASSFTGSFSGFSGGAANYIPMWVSATAQSSSVMFQSGVNVGIATTSPAQRLDVNGTGLFRDVLHFGPSIGMISWGTMGGGTGFGIRGESGRGLSLGSNGTWDRVVIDTSGNVGIGTTSPSAKLHVEGQSTLFKNATSDVTHSLGNSAYGWKLQYSTGKFIWFNNSVDNMTLDNGGRVGIGTTNPNARLEINNSGASVGNYLRINNTSGKNWELMAGISGISNDGFGIYSVTDSVYRLVITSAGNVGIGTTSPGTLLHVQGSASASTFIGSLSGNASSATFATTVNGTSGQLYTKDDRIIEPNSISNGYLQFGFTSWNNNNTSPYADYLHLRSYLDSSGGADNLVMFSKTGIGMRIYQHVFGTGSAYSSFKDMAFTDGTNATGTWPVTASSLSGGAAGYIPLWSSATAQSSSVMFQTANGVLVGRTSKIITETFSSTGYAIIGGTTVQGIIGDAGSGLVTLGGYSNHDVELRTNNTERMRITNGGNVAINTTSPNARLTVNGPITVTGSSGLAGAVLIGGDNQSTFDLKLQRISGGIRAVENSYAHVNNSPWYLFGQNLTWTGERAGTVESTQASRPYYEAYAPSGGTKEFGFINVTSGNFTSANLVPTMIFTNTGNVGVGTSSPTSRLQVSGSSAVAASGDYSIFTIEGAGASGLTFGYDSTAQQSWIYSRTAGLASRQLNLNSSVYIAGFSGNVGIGTSTPDANLTVQSQASFNSGSLTNPGIAARGNLNTGLYFPTADTIGFVEGGSEVMRITSAGNVGIGTTTPQYKQDVISVANTFAASFGTTMSVGGFSGIHFGYLEQANTSYRKSALVFERTDNNLQGGNASGKIHLLLNNAGASSATSLTSAVMTIDSNASGSNGTARVGISNRAPSSSLHIVGDSVTPGLLQLQNSSLAQVLYVSSSGNVGIGTLTPGYILDVNGSVNFTSTTRINTVTYTWPSSQGSSNTYLRNNGSGTLSWTSVTSTGDPSLNIIKATLFSAF